MSIKIYQLDKDFADAVNEMGGKITFKYGDGDIDVVFPTRCKVAMVTMDNDCVGFSSPKNIGFVASSVDFRSIEIF